MLELSGATSRFFRQHASMVRQRGPRVVAQHVTKPASAAKRLDHSDVAHLGARTSTPPAAFARRHSRACPISPTPSCVLLHAHSSTSCRTKLTNMSSVTAHPVDDLAHPDALVARTRPAAVHAVEEETAKSTAAVTVAHVRPTAVRRVREATSLTAAQVEELRRVQSRARTT